MPCKWAANGKWVGYREVSYITGEKEHGEDKKISRLIKSIYIERAVVRKFYDLFGGMGMGKGLERTQVPQWSSLDESILRLILVEQ